MKSSLRTSRAESPVRTLLPYTVIPAIFAVIFFSQSNKLTPAFGFVITLGLGLFLAFSRSEFAVAQSAAADERQAQMNKTAIMFAYFAVVATALVGFFFELVRGTGAGPFALICFVGGCTHMASLLFLRRRM